MDVAHDAKNSGRSSTQFVQLQGQKQSGVADHLQRSHDTNERVDQKNGGGRQLVLVPLVKEGWDNFST